MEIHRALNTGDMYTGQKQLAHLMGTYRALNTGDMYTGAETAGSPDGDTQGRIDRITTAGSNL